MYKETNVETLVCEAIRDNKLEGITMEDLKALASTTDQKQALKLAVKVLAALDCYEPFTHYNWASLVERVQSGTVERIMFHAVGDAVYDAFKRKAKPETDEQIKEFMGRLKLCGFLQTYVDIDPIEAYWNGLKY